MQKEYITEYNGEFNVIKFTLSTGTEVYLSEDEQEELFDNSSVAEELRTKLHNHKNEVLGLETKLEHKQKIIDSYLAFQDLIKSERS